MASIDKREWKGGISYRARVRVNGQTRIATFKRKTDALQWAGETEAALKRGRYVPTRDDMRRTVADLVDRYVEDVLPTKVKNKDRRTFRQRLTWWKTAIGGYALADVTPGLIGECRDKLSRTTNHYGERLSPATLNRYLAAFSAGLKHAVNEWQWLDDNPMRRVTKRAESRGRVRYLSEAERERLLAACRESDNPYLYPAVVLALATGARKGELFKLRWRNVDLERGVMTLWNTKAGDDRTLPLPRPALEVLADCAKVQRINTDLVFPGKTGRPAIIDKPWREALERAQVEDFRFHDLRHSCASYLAMNGATLAEIAEILGHKTLQMVKRYSHLSEQHTAGMLTRMNDAIFKTDRQA